MILFQLASNKLILDIVTWHPLTVHFPIAFLSLAGILSLYLALKFNKQLAQFNLGLLFLGVLLALVSIYTGDQEDGRVSRTLCDPTVLKTHENFAYYMIWCFTSLLVFWIARLFTVLKSFKSLLTILILISSLSGLATLIYTGHLGASLVYEQAAGVEIPGEDCADF